MVMIPRTSKTSRLEDNAREKNTFIGAT